MATAKKTQPAYLKKKPGEWPDLLKEMANKRLELKRQVDAMEVEEKEFKAYIIENMKAKTGGTGVAGQAYRIDVKDKLVPQVQDWDGFYKHILKTKDFGFLNRALNAGHVQEMWDAGKIVPGVQAFETQTISLTKI